MLNMNQEFIDRETLVKFVAENAFEAIGIAENGKVTNLSDEMAAIAKMISRADVCRIAVDPYRTRLAYSLAELTETGKMAEVVYSYRKASKKILWFNSICRTRSGKPFIKKVVSMNSMEEVEKLVDEFEAEIRYASLNQ